MASSVQYTEVSEADDGQRLDRWLKKYGRGIPYGLAQKLIRTGAIRVDGKRAKPDTRLSAGQTVRLPPIEEKADKPSYTITPEDKAFMASLVLYDDGDVIALNKPYGIATQGGGREWRHIDALLPALAGKKGVVPRLVHRLDKETSGVLLLARSAEAVRALGRIFKGRGVEKTYWGLVSPVPDVNEGTIRGAIGKVAGPHKDKMTLDGAEAKNATTDFVLVERAGNDIAFIAFRPLTGRTHQIRVHAAEALECPLLGDAKYGAEELAPDMAGVAPRLHLHARQLVLPHPLKEKETLTFKAPLPPDLEKSWKAFGFDPNLKEDPFAL